MPNRTSIEWTATHHPDGTVTPGYTSNPLRAVNTDTGKDGTFCVHVSPGCANCYAGRLNRWRGNGLDFIAQNAGRVEFRINERELHSWTRLPAGAKVFVCDMCDLFFEGVTDALIGRIFAAIALRPDVTFQVLTKRPERMREWLIAPGWDECNRRAAWPSFPLPNVWLGVSVEDQRRADERIPLLLQCPAAVRFISAEPLLGRVDLTRVAFWESHKSEHHDDYRCRWTDALNGVAYVGDVNGDADAETNRLDWVIVGGESGPGARPCDLAWIRSLVEQCAAARVPAFVKQLGARPYVVEDDGQGGSDIPGVPHAATAGLYSPDRKGGDPAHWPADLRVREFPEVAP